ncbi:unnamed protein product [Didymodactylos carnosus]|uniref:N-acetyltransferase domain-containing protein n=1 Tax=Didymodactylos carnosus TaxID=1234261 RepID=A0A815JI02_9BILA|nr:unnamed protein product [Didymodactylos carnosus]CAF4277840.1 unnamed protein product [Didymodactylos carnosus]
MTATEIFIVQVDEGQLQEYATIPISFEVRSRFEMKIGDDNGLRGIELCEQPIATPYIKDYDLLGCSPLTWTEEFSLKDWGLFLAFSNEQPVGGAAIASKLPGEDGDMTVLWDMRVHPAYRRQKIGHKLWQHVLAWSKRPQNCCKYMKIETQNTNISACRFYAAQGAQLGDIRRFAYRHQASVEDEVQLNWYVGL